MNDEQKKEYIQKIKDKLDDPELTSFIFMCSYGEDSEENGLTALNSSPYDMLFMFSSLFLEYPALIKIIEAAISYSGFVTMSKQSEMLENLKGLFTLPHDPEVYE